MYILQTQQFKYRNSLTFTHGDIYKDIHCEIDCNRKKRRKKKGKKEGGKWRKEWSEVRGMNGMGRETLKCAPAGNK